MTMTEKIKASIDLCCPDSEYPSPSVKCPSCRSNVRALMLEKACRYQSAAWRLLFISHGDLTLDQHRRRIDAQWDLFERAKRIYKQAENI